jgi:DNA-directed RNA polymerase subunit P
MVSSYKWARCKQKVEIDVNVRCPYCGHRILFKERGAAIKEVKAR